MVLSSILQDLANHPTVTSHVDANYRVLYDVVIMVGGQFLHFAEGELLSQHTLYQSFNSTILHSGVNIANSILNNSASANNLCDALEHWNDTFKEENKSELNSFIETILDTRQCVSEIPQNSVDSLKSLFETDSYCQVQLPNQTNIGIFSQPKTNETKYKRSYRRTVVNQFNNLKNWVVPLQTALFFVSIFLLSWSIYKLHKVYRDCKIVEHLIEEDKETLISELDVLEGILARIIKALEDDSEDRFERNVSTLIEKSENFIKVIGNINDEIQKKSKEFNYKAWMSTIEKTVSAVISVASLAVTYANWSNWNTTQRATGIVSGGAGAASAYYFHLSEKQLQQMQYVMDEFVKNTKSLTKFLKELKASTRHQYDTNLKDLFD
ncbi:21790_t:CDS:2, partial [Dentiscutata erythropus]